MYPDFSCCKFRLLFNLHGKILRLCSLLKFSHKLSDFFSSNIVSRTVCELHERSSEIESINEVSVSIQKVSTADF